jgi:hypothetical protein
VGILQITGIAIKVLLFLHEKIKIYCSYFKEAKRIFKGIKLQQKILVYEIHSLLRLAKQCEDDIKRMLQDRTKRSGGVDIYSPSPVLHSPGVWTLFRI